MANFLYGLITYNRIDYLKKHIESFISTRDPVHTWTLVIMDDGSTDGSWEYLQSLVIPGVEVHCYKNDRRGVHYQTNRVLKCFDTGSFDFGFCAQDDVFFIAKNWGRAYYAAALQTGYHHLCYFNKDWALSHGRSAHVTHEILVPHQNLQSYIPAYNCFGVFWTFTPSVLKDVGYFDTANFGLCGNGHTDFSLRCCRAGFNVPRTFYDVHRSEQYIKMQDRDYHRAPLPNDAQNIGVPNRQHKGRTLEKTNRMYIPYNESSLALES